jgi:methionine salvage enolase-phosphatase E1
MAFCCISVQMRQSSKIYVSHAKKKSFVEQARYTRPLYLMSNSGGCENVVASVSAQGREKLSKEQLAAQHQARIDAMRPRRKKQIQVNSQVQGYLSSVISCHLYDEFLLPFLILLYNE